jgi:hypothetical protein
MKMKLASLNNPRLKLSIVSVVVVIIAYVIYNVYFKLEYSPIVQTSSGKIRGFVAESRLGKRFYKFLGIRYGIPQRFSVSITYIHYIYKTKTIQPDR